MNNLTKIFTCIIILLTSTICSCSHRTYSPPTVNVHERVDIGRDTVMRFVWRVDSVVNTDTVRIVAKGDTVFRDLIKWRWRTRTVHDTVYKSGARYIIVHDSIDRPVPYPVEKIKKVTVHKKLSAWQKFKISAFWPLVIVTVGLLIFTFRKPVLRLLCRLKL